MQVPDKFTLAHRYVFKYRRALEFSITLLDAPLHLAVGHGPGVVRGPRLGVETRRLAAGTGRVVTTRAGMSVGLDVGVAVFPTVLVAPHFIITVMRRVAVTPRGRPPARAAARQRTMSVAVAAGTGASVLRHLRALVRDVNSVAGVTATAAAASAGRRHRGVLAGAFRRRVVRRRRDEFGPVRRRQQHRGSVRSRVLRGLFAVVEGGQAAGVHFGVVRGLGERNGRVFVAVGLPPAAVDPESVFGVELGRVHHRHVQMSQLFAQRLALLQVDQADDDAQDGEDREGQEDDEPSLLDQRDERSEGSRALGSGSRQQRHRIGIGTLSGVSQSGDSSVVRASRCQIADQH